ncbi:hypothetical protein T12_3574 [Trichinella patagoniensis]|uniref:Uncharacterized protein n=1 Tax=Trichinella patagoniensis TaxID=990121 RepID=A0A0V1A8I4_9BILA|nr:hypothetical protein T12_3574 [Trichinella patagoniensis]
MTVSKRLRLCFLRLREGHRVAACNTKGRCQKQAVMDDIILHRTGEYRRRWAVKGCEPSKWAVQGNKSRKHRVTEDGR